MGVEVRSDGRGRVAEPFRDDLDIYSRCESETCVGVPEVVHPDYRQACLAREPLEVSGYVFRPQVPPVLSGEDEPLIVPGRTPADFSSC
jgi:hypothetical protein